MLSDLLATAKATDPDTLVAVPERTMLLAAVAAEKVASLEAVQKVL